MSDGENVVVDELSASERDTDTKKVEAFKEWGREHGLQQMGYLASTPWQQRAYRELVQEEKERYQPTEKRVRELLGAMPECPRTRGALEKVPESVKQEWRDAFIREFFRWYGPGSSLDLQECAKRAHRKANAMFRAERPETIEEASTIPEWKLLRRQELDFSDLPPHAQSEMRERKARASGAYLEVFTIDGGQYFFEVPSAA